MKQGPLVVAIAGSNGAGKTTFYETQLKWLGLHFVNADNLARQLQLDAYKAAALADDLRRELSRHGESFIFETVFSDPVGDKVTYLKSLEDSGYDVQLCFIGISAAAVSEQRVAMRVSKGGHDVPAGKIRERYARTLRNLEFAMRELQSVRVFDNDDIDRPYQLIARCENGQVAQLNKPVPKWLRPLLPKSKSNV